MCNGDGFINRHGNKEVCLNKGAVHKCYCKECTTNQKMFRSKDELKRCYGTGAFIFR